MEYELTKVLHNDNLSMRAKLLFVYLRRKGTDKKYKDIRKYFKETQEEVIAAAEELEDNNLATITRRGSGYTFSVQTAKKEVIEKTFAQFWEEYPKKKGKKPAYDKWRNLPITKDFYVMVMVALKHQKQLHQWQDQQYIPNAARWIREEMWNDIVDHSAQMEEDKQRAGTVEVPQEFKDSGCTCLSIDWRREHGKYIFSHQIRNKKKCPIEENLIGISSLSYQKLVEKISV